jgi:hypothetical protein
MQTHAKKETADRNQTPGRAAGTFQFADRRPETAAQNRLQTLAQSSPQTAQLQAIQARADAGAAASGQLQSETVQRQTEDDDKPLQGKFDTVQREAEDEE